MSDEGLREALSTMDHDYRAAVRADDLYGSPCVYRGGADTPCGQPPEGPRHPTLGNLRAALACTDAEQGARTDG